MRMTGKKLISFLLVVIVFFGTVGIGMTDIEIPYITVKAEAENNADYSGVCGENLIWTFNKKTGMLEISGTGDMYNYENFSDMLPWSSFKNTIKTVVINPGTKSIGSMAFSSCENLSLVILGSGLERIGKYAFGYCDSLRDIYIPQGVKEIGDSAFFSSSLMSIEFPDSVERIGNSAFEYCYMLSDITIPDSVKRIGSYAFRDTAYFEEPRNWKYGALYIDNHLIVVNSSEINDVFILPYKIVNIADQAFERCTTLVDFRAFGNLKRIGRWAFADCSSLAEITLPDSVREINEFAFDDTAYVKKQINVVNNAVYIGNHLITLIDSFGETYEIAEGTVSIASKAFFYNDNISNVLLPDSIKGISSYAFSYCEELLKIIIPDGIEYIGTTAFSNCDSLEFVHIPKNVMEISSDLAEYYCNDFYICSDSDLTCVFDYAIENNLDFKLCNGHDEVQEHSHAFDVTVITESNCTENGYREYVCYCGESYSKSINAYGHKPGNWIVEEEATAENEGKKIKKCTVCNEIVETSVIPKPVTTTVVPTTAAITIPSATETTTVSYAVKCPYCGAKYDDSISYINHLSETYKITITSYQSNGKRVLFAQGKDLPNGWTIKWIADNDNFILNVFDNERRCMIEPVKSGKTTFIATVIDSVGRTIARDIWSVVINIEDTTVREETTELTSAINSEFESSSQVTITENTTSGHSLLDKPTEIITSTVVFVEKTTNVSSSKNTTTASTSVPVTTRPAEVPATTKPATTEPSTVPISSQPTAIPSTQPITEKKVTVEIRKPSQTEIKYGDSIILHADIDKVPEGGKIVWTADNSNFTYTVSADGKTCIISPESSGDTTFTATIYDAAGNLVSTDEQTMESKAGLFQKIIAFFKGLFGLNKVIPEVFKWIF